MEERWLVTVHYHSDLGELDVDYRVKNLDEVSLLIAQGPDDRSVRLVRIIPLVDAMTIEATVADRKKVNTNEH